MADLNRDLLAGGEATTAGMQAASILGGTGQPATGGAPEALEAEVARLLAQGSVLPEALAPVADGSAARALGIPGFASPSDIAAHVTTYANKLAEHAVGNAGDLLAAATDGGDVGGAAIGLENELIKDVHALLETIAHDVPVTNGLIHAVTGLGETIGLGQVGTGGLDGTGNLATDIVQLPGTVLGGGDIGQTIGQVVDHTGDVVGATGGILPAAGLDGQTLGGVLGGLTGQDGHPLAVLDGLGGASQPGGILGAVVNGESGRPLIDLDLVGDGPSNGHGHVVEADAGPAASPSPLNVDVFASHDEPGSTAGIAIGDGPTLVDVDALTGTDHLQAPTLVGGGNASPILVADVVGGASEHGGLLGAVVQQGVSSAAPLVDVDVAGDGRSGATPHLAEGLVGPASAGQVAGVNALTAPEPISNPVSAIVGDGPSLVAANVLTDAVHVPALNGGLDALVGQATAPTTSPAPDLSHVAGVQAPLLSGGEALAPDTHVADSGAQHALLGSHGLL